MYADEVGDIMMRYGTYAARRKYELLEPHVYIVINHNYNEGGAAGRDTAGPCPFSSAVTSSPAVPSPVYDVPEEPGG